MRVRGEVWRARAETAETPHDLAFVVESMNLGVRPLGFLSCISTHHGL